MKRIFTCVLIFIWGFQFFAQTYAPAPGNPGTTAIHKDSSALVFWASGVELQRGYLDISNKSLGSPAFGTAENALGKPEGNSFDIVSLGDSGVVIFTFPYAISNGTGYDFAVFENGFTDNYLELAFVEVSSDGINYVRFPAVSEIPADEQMGNYQFSDCRYVNNLAGKYRQGFGTPFDLEELTGSGVDLNAVTHIKIIDVIGSIDPQYGSFDSQGNIINDPWPSAFDSGGFDLDGVGVIHSEELGTAEKEFPYMLSDKGTSLILTSPEDLEVLLLSPDGRILEELRLKNGSLELLRRPEPQLIFLILKSPVKRQCIRIFY